MEAYMELSKKTTILFSPELHERLSRLAVERGTSLGDLVRRACERQYGLPTKEEKLAAVRGLATLTLPVGDPKQMKRESVPDPQELLP
jgi:predicted DNA-binding protein